MDIIEKRSLGRTGLKVSRLALGTAALGMDYGITSSEDKTSSRRKRGVATIQFALESGINFFDTAPGYGDAEQLIGEVVGPEKGLIIATKFVVPRENGKPILGDKLRESLRRSLERSLHNLKRDVLDIVQIHNADKTILKEEEIIGVLQEAKDKGILRFIGATVYGREAAMMTIEAKEIDVVQIAFSILDQYTQKEFMETASRSGMGVYNRSALLKGALTKRISLLKDDFFLPIKEKVFALNTDFHSPYKRQ